MSRANSVPLTIALAILVSHGCDLRSARFEYPVKSGTLRVAQFADDLTFTFVDASGSVQAQVKQFNPYTIVNKDAYVIVDTDDILLLLHTHSIVNRLPQDKTDKNGLVQAMAEQTAKVVYSRSTRAFLNLQVDKPELSMTDDFRKQVLSTVVRLDIHEPVNAAVMATLHSFPSLEAIVIGNQRIEADALVVHHLPATIRTVNIALCRNIADRDALVSELNGSGVTRLLLNKDQADSFGDRLRMELSVISPD